MKTDWTGRNVSIGFDGIVTDKELGLREDGMVVWRTAQSKKNHCGYSTGEVIKETTHKIRLCPKCKHPHPVDRTCGYVLERDKSGRAFQFCKCEE